MSEQVANYAVPVVMIAHGLMKVSGRVVDIHQIKAIYVSETGQITGIQFIDYVGKEGWEDEDILDVPNSIKRAFDEG